MRRRQKEMKKLKKLLKNGYSRKRSVANQRPQPHKMEFSMPQSQASETKDKDKVQKTSLLLQNPHLKKLLLHMIKMT